MIQEAEPNPAVGAGAPVARNADRSRQKRTDQEVRTRLFAEAWRHAVHDLRGHLGVLKNSMAVVSQEGASGPMRADCLRMFQESAGAMNALLSDLMALANLEAGRDHPRVQPFDAATLVREVCEEVERSARDRGVTVQARGPGVLTVVGDAAKVRKITRDLLAVALESNPGGEVWVCCEALAEEDSNDWALSVHTPPPGPAATSAGPKPLSSQIRNLMIDALCSLLGARFEAKVDASQGWTARVTFSRPDRSASAHGGTP
jgi:signal transduction histidine kinase